MRPQDIVGLVDVGQPRLSPDATQVAFVVTTVDLEGNDYRSRVWLADVDGATRPRPFTRGEAKDNRPRWSPDGRFLAFTSQRGEDAATDIVVLPVTVGGEPRTVACSKEDVESLEWSPDGTRIAYATRVRDPRYDNKKPKDQPARRIERFFWRLDSVGWTVDRPRHLFVADVERDGPPRQVTFGDVDDSGLAWSPDGRSLYFASSRHEDWDFKRAQDLFVVTVDGDSDGEPEPERLTPTDMTHYQPSVSPDGRVACMWSDQKVSPTHAQVAVVEDGAVRLLTTSLDRHCSPYVGGAREPLWDGDALLFGIEDAGNVHLYRVGADGASAPALVVGGQRTVTGWDTAGGVLAFTAGTATELAELFVLVDGTERRLTSIGEPFTRGCEMAAPERFTAVSSDGAEVEAWVIRPLDFDPDQSYPALLNIHGGPFTQYGNRPFDEFQVQAGAGYVVLYSNPRGSAGYSEAWGRAIRGPTAEPDPGSGWGGVDYDDLMAVVDTACKQFSFIDPERLGVLGGSYGGYMATWIVGHTNRFAAACSERAVNNLLTMEHTSDIATVFEEYVGARHIDDPDEYRRQSPMTYVRDIDTPVLILHSEDDLRCPIEQSEELFIALRLLGKPVEYVRFPGESHELTRSGAPRHRIERFEILLDFFDRHLKP